VRSLEGCRARGVIEWEGITSVGSGGSEASLGEFTFLKKARERELIVFVRGNSLVECEEERWNGDSYCCYCYCFGG